MCPVVSQKFTQRNRPYHEYPLFYVHVDSQCKFPILSFQHTVPSFSGNCTLLNKHPRSHSPSTHGGGGCAPCECEGRARDPAWPINWQSPHTRKWFRMSSDKSWSEQNEPYPCCGETLPRTGTAKSPRIAPSAPTAALFLPAEPSPQSRGREGIAWSPSTSAVSCGHLTRPSQ